MSKYDVISSSPVEDELFLEYFLGNSLEEAEELYLNYENSLNYMASSYAMWAGLDKGDLFGAGLTGLARAVRDFDPNRGGRFHNFAVRKIKNAMNEHCRVYKGVITVPVYIRTAHTHIRNIKGLLEAYAVDPYEISECLAKGYVSSNIYLVKADWKRIDSEFEKLENVAKNFNIKYDTLIEQAEFIPTELSFDESMTQEEMHERNNRLVGAALLVSKLKDHMTDQELFIADSIMEGKTYEEIGDEMNPPVSKARVKQILNEMKDKFKKLMGES